MPDSWIYSSEMHKLLDYIPDRDCRGEMGVSSVGYEANLLLFLHCWGMLTGFVGAVIYAVQETCDDTSFLDLPESSLTWICDPIDGTTNFVHGFPVTCVSIALTVGNEVNQVYGNICQDGRFYLLR